MSNGPFPETLVLPFTTLYRDSGCPGDFATQLAQGNTFSAAFDMSQAPHAPLEDGVVYLTTDQESNFVAGSRVELANEGLSDAIGFMSIATTPARIFGGEQTVTRVFLVGRPAGSVFTWQAGMIIGDNCVVTNGAVDEALLARLAR